MFSNLLFKDADRLDSIGAAGIGRTFTYSGSHNLPMENSRTLFDTKLFSLESIMKTTTGRKMAQERTELLRHFAVAWDAETSIQSDEGFHALSAMSSIPPNVSRFNRLLSP